MDTESQLSTHHLKKLSDLYDHVGLIHGVSGDTVKKIVESNFHFIANHIRSRRSDKILLNGFGSFQMSPRMVDHISRGLIRSYLKGKMKREDLKRELEVLFKLRRELKNA